MPDSLDFKALIGAAASLMGLFLLSTVLSNIPTITIAGIPVTIIGQSLGIYLKFFTLWLFYMLLIIYTLYGVFKLIMTAEAWIKQLQAFMQKFQ